MACQLKLSTITDPFTGLSEILPLYEVRNAVGGLRSRLNNRSLILPKTFVLSTTAGPNFSKSMRGIHLDILA